MPYTDPDLSDILTNEQTMNTRLTTYRNKLKAILDNDGISYDENLGINGLIRLLQLPIPTTIELNSRKTFLTKDGPQSSNRSTYFYPVVRDQHGNAMDSVPLTIRKKSSISGSSWQNVETMVSMFAKSQFTGENGDISNWNIKPNVRMSSMFKKCPLEKNPPSWYHKK